MKSEYPQAKQGISTLNYNLADLKPAQLSHLRYKRASAP